MKHFILFIAVLMFVGCGTYKTTFSTNVTSFHSMGSGNNPSAITGKTFDVAHPDKRSNDSLEFASYKKMIVRRLESRGLKLDTKSPELLVVVNYHISGGKEKVGSRPVFGQTGGGRSTFSGNTYGSGGSGNFSGSTYSAPTYGVVGSRAYSYTVFTRKLDIEIIDRESLKADSQKKIYEAKAISTGSSGELARVLPYMIESVFREFPAKNGQSRSADIKEGELVEQIEQKAEEGEK